jgi:predicted acylesterase/phospholipase RssA
MPGADASSPPPVRLSLSLAGGASLGAYEAGATAAVCTAVTELRARGEPVVVDATGGASAGALVALIASHCLLDGLDAADVLHTAWVDEVSLELLRGRGASAPLSQDGL